MIIGKLRHRNLVRLQGWCHERGELLLVYDYMPNGSLDKLLFGKVDVKPQESPPARAEHRLDEVCLNNSVVNIAIPKFPWERRFKIIVDVTTALVYLHTECEERIIHRDVKAANVMLDAKFNARLGDFGLARSYNHSLLTPESTNVAGTFGYLAPELFHRCPHFCLPPAACSGENCAQSDGASKRSRRMCTASGHSCWRWRAEGSPSSARTMKWGCWWTMCGGCGEIRRFWTPQTLSWRGCSTRSR